MEDLRNISTKYNNCILFIFAHIVMQKEPLISICIPTYNRHKLLKTCLDRIVSQKWFDTETIEIVISDNASPDITKSLVHEYQKKYLNIKYFRNEENVWANLNLFKAAERATGKYIWFMGDDDQIIDWWLRQIIKTINIHHNIALLHTNMIAGVHNIEIKDWITYFKNLLHHNKASKLLVFLTYLSALVVKREDFIQHFDEFKIKFPYKLKEAYSHFYIFIRCINNKNIALLGDIIIWWVWDRTDKTYRRNNSKIWYDLVIINGINKIYEDSEFLDSIGITKKELDVFKHNFLKIYRMVKIGNFMKRIWIYKPMVYIFKKLLFKRI